MPAHQRPTRPLPAKVSPPPLSATCQHTAHLSLFLRARPKLFRSFTRHKSTATPVAPLPDIKLLQGRPSPAILARRRTRSTGQSTTLKTAVAGEWPSHRVQDLDPDGLAVQRRQRIKLESATSTDHLTGEEALTATYGGHGIAAQCGESSYSLITRPEASSDRCFGPVIGSPTR